MSESIKIGNQWRTVSLYYRKDGNSWVSLTQNEFTSLCNTQSFTFGGDVDGGHTLTIAGPSVFEGLSCSYVAVYDGVVDVTTSATWSIVSGGEYATINSGNGEVDLLASASGSTVVVRAVYGGVSAQQTVTLTYKTGTTSRTDTEIVVDESGNTTTTTTTVTENEDGTSTEENVTITTDEGGNVIGTVESEVTTNSDGSFTGTTTNYDSEGTPIGGENTSGDTEGNVNTQGVEYDENGNSAVTSYEIDTSENPDGNKTYNGDGVNTEYYAFDVTRGFILDFHFTIDCANQPAGQNENHHNILTAKRATPSPWYGFQIRQSSTNKTVQLGTQFATGSNTNTSLQAASSTGNTLEYNLQIVYDPTAASNSFVCKNKATGTNYYTSSLKFPDINELKYLKVTIGYAMDENGDPFRYSNINVKEFSLRRLPVTLVPPVVSCDGRFITLTCETSGARIYYRLNQSGSYVSYSSPIAITADTVIEAYSMIDGEPSTTVTQNCVYDSGVVTPVITCNGTQVYISCDTVGADIYYSLNQSGSYTMYNNPITITADTVVEAYSELDGYSSETVSQTCVYTPEHSYENDYLTLQVLTGGTIAWTTTGVASPKTFQYSINNGSWVTEVTGIGSINVEAGDTVRLKGTNNSYASTNADYFGFSGGTASFNVEGNIMSLVYGDNFIGNTALTGTFNFCSLFKQSNAISAENLILPAMTLTPHCYRALFANSPSLVTAPVLPATTLAEACYRYMFQDNSITIAPDLPAPIMVTDCYDGMFNGCSALTYIKCMATDISAPSATTAWVRYVNTTNGTFVKDVNTEWTRGESGIPTRWIIDEVGLAIPSVECDGLSIELSCKTQGATIYYRINELGEYSAYTTPISITADTVIETYSSFSGETSTIRKETCIYDDGIDEPVIYCDGEYITISCETGGATINYKITGMNTYEEYETSIVITSDTICWAYSEINGVSSEVVTAECIYDESLKAPIIDCDGLEVTITCHTPSSSIYYKIDDEVSYTLYSSAIPISANTMVYAYSELSGVTSSVVTKNCIYNPNHDYSRDYLTFSILSDGTVKWNSIGSGQAKTISYSVNNGPWTSILASTSSTISVSTGDKVRFRGTNTTYAKDKSNYSGFEGGTASFNIEGNIMSLVHGAEFEGQTSLTGTYNFCSMFKLSNCVSAKNLVLPTLTLTNYCYRAMFSKCTNLIEAPALPATTLSQGCYWYMFEECAITTAPELMAEEMVRECYGYMFVACRSLNYIKCMAINGFSAASGRTKWVENVAASGTFVKDGSVSVSTWTRGSNGIPTSWLVYDGVSVATPEIACGANNAVTITCETQGANIFYRINNDGSYSAYTTAITITADTVFEAYSELDGQESRVVSQTCEYVSNIPLEASNRNLSKWLYNSTEVTTPYSVNALDGHSSSYAKGTFNFETTFALREVQPTYLWFQHADQSATVYIDDTLVEKHWGGYAAFFVDVTNYVHVGSNKVKVALKNNEGNNLAPASADFNFNATLGNVKLFTSPCLPAMNYGYDGFHVTSQVSISSATVNVRTAIPTGATAVCTIDDGTYHYSDTANTTGNEMVFTTIIQNPHLWNGTSDPHLYTITLEIYYNGELYHRYQRPYGLRFYSYVINDTTVLPGNEPYTGFLLNGSPYLLRGVCMHDDIAGKANALTDNDYTLTYNTIQELGCNFMRLAHYPHPKETYDWCDRLGIIVQTEGPCVNKMQSTMPAEYFEHLNGQYDDMVNQHYNHPCIMFWGLSNETTTDDKDFAKEKMNGYIARIRALDTERMIGYVMAQGPGTDPSAYYNNPNADWFGCNIYEGWYSNTNSNNPSTQINTRVKNVITNKRKALAYSEYGCGGTQRCHSDDFMTTTTRGNNPRHDIEYMMWLHEGHIAAIKNYPQLLFTAQWQLFDIAVANRNEGYTVCTDGVNTSIDDNLRRLNDKGLVERDHVTKKDPFYLYKAWWNTTDKFVHICGKDYTKTTDRVIKCYTNDDNNGSLALYVNDTFVENAAVTDNIATFTSATYNSGDVVRVVGAESNDTLTF